MYPHQLIGKKALRTKPVGSDHSYTTTPIEILAVTESHVVYRSNWNEDKKLILNGQWMDNNWTDYDALMGLASDEHIKLMQELGQ